MIYKKGKKVKIKKYERRPIFWNSEGEMDKYMGKIVTMIKFDGCIRIKEDNKFWSWSLSDFEELNDFKLLDDDLFKI